MSKLYFHGGRNDEESTVLEATLAQLNWVELSFSWSWAKADQYCKLEENIIAHYILIICYTNFGEYFFFVHNKAFYPHDTFTIPKDSEIIS